MGNCDTYVGVDETLELFGYDTVLEGGPALNRAGFAHIAFEVDDVEYALQKVLSEGGGQAGQLVTAEYPGDVTATFVYATDPEGNLIELQSWKKVEIG
jgi:catechol 2,3-dioxygenase-like lactoylglutathione lyase family enzyme